MKDMELFTKLRDAERREHKDDHLTTEERQELVSAVLEFYKDSPSILRDFPYDKDINSQFVYIIFDLQEN